MDKFYNQILDKIVINLKKPEFKNKINYHIINPLMNSINSKINKYLIVVISLYVLIIILQLIIISIIIKRKNNY